MKRTFLLAQVMVMLLGTSAAPVAVVHASRGKHHKVRPPRVMLKFGTNYGVDGPFLNYEIREGLPGDSRPWEVERIHGVLLEDGTLTILVRGLIIPDRPDVFPESVRGINPSPQFRAAVSCLNEVGDDVVIENVISQGFPANQQGDSFIHTKLELPETCAAPIVFILSGRNNVWFSVTGVENEEEEEEEEED